MDTELDVCVTVRH